MGAAGMCDRSKDELGAVAIKAGEFLVQIHRLAMKQGSNDSQHPSFAT